VIKRALDIGSSAVGLLLLSPFLLSLAALIKWGSEGPIFYRGRRVGRYGKPFRIFKFRSMVVNAETIGGSSTSDQDPRITPIGRFMRKLKLDELPQLLNVLLGNMSIVGPRPEVQHYVDLYTPEERAILQVRPGITDWASIWNSDEGAILAGSADPDKAYEELIRPTKLKLQLLYVGNHSVWNDVKIIGYTFLSLFNKGILPREIRQVTVALAPPDKVARDPSHEVEQDYATVTELPGHGATLEQLSMIHTRYRFAAELAKDKDVLELACGPGIALGYLKTVARRVVGGDVDGQLVEAASRHYGSRVEIHQIDAQDIPYDDHTFDVILLLEAIYYLPDVQKFISEAQRVLRRDGTIMICSANRERPDFNPSPYTHHYSSAAELQQLLLDNDFRVELYGAYPLATAGFKSRVLKTVRQVAVKLHLVPKTMAWKILLKRLLYGTLAPIPAEISVDQQQCAELVPIDSAAPVRGYKVIYAVGRRAA